MGAGAGGFATDIDDMCACCNKGLCLEYGGIWIFKPAAIREGVWGNVEDSHDQRGGGEVEGTF